MDETAAIQRLKSILETHAQTVGTERPELVLRNAETDLISLLHVIFKNCRPIDYTQE